jgi:hypothetical protein
MKTAQTHEKVIEIRVLTPFDCARWSLSQPQVALLFD